MKASWHTGGSLLHCLDVAAHSKEPRRGVEEVSSDV